MTYEQIIFWSKFIFLATVIIAAVIGFVSYKNFPHKRWGDALWILSTFMWMMLGLLIGLLTSLMIRDHWFDIYNVINPYAI